MILVPVKMNDELGASREQKAAGSSYSYFIQRMRHLLHRRMLVFEKGKAKGTSLTNLAKRWKIFKFCPRRFYLLVLKGNLTGQSCLFQL